MTTCSVAIVVVFDNISVENVVVPDNTIVVTAVISDNAMVVTDDSDRGPAQIATCQF